MMDIWLLHDPQTNRVSIQSTEPSESSYPPGMRGSGWKVRQAQIDEAVLARLLSGEMSDDESDQVHRDLWTQNGATAWPSQ